MYMYIYTHVIFKLRREVQDLKEIMGKEVFMAVQSVGNFPMMLPRGYKTWPL